MDRPAPPRVSGTWIDLPTHGDGRGALTVAEEAVGLPFAPVRSYWLHDLTGAPRGGHAHRRLSQLMVALAGSLTVELEDAAGPREVTLDDPRRGLLVAPMTWRVMRDFAEATVLLVLASRPYEPEDYIHDRAAFRTQLALFAAARGA